MDKLTKIVAIAYLVTLILFGVILITIQPEGWGFWTALNIPIYIAIVIGFVYVTITSVLLAKNGASVFFNLKILKIAVLLLSILPAISVIGFSFKSWLDIVLSGPSAAIILVIFQIIIYGTTRVIYSK